MSIKIIVRLLLVVLLSAGISSDVSARGRWHYRNGWHRHHRVVRVFRHEHVTKHVEYDVYFHGRHRHEHKHHPYHHYRYYRD